MRLCHYIKPNKNSESPSRAMFLSIDMEEHAVGVADYEYTFYSATAVCAIKDSKSGKWNSKTYPLENLDQTWRLIESFVKNKKKTYIICNLSNHALTLLDVFQTGPTRGWILGTIVVSCPPCIVTMRHGTQAATILDIQNIWPTLFLDTYVGANGEPLKKNRTVAVPLPEGKPSVGAAEMMFKEMTQWWTFLKENDLGGFSPTVGAQAVRTWRHRYMTQNVLIDCHDEALALARAGLFGGRNECFRTGRFNGHFTMLDVNAAYIYCMGRMRVPARLIGYTHSATVGDIQEWSKTAVVIAEAEVDTDENAYPYRGEHSLSFPIGQFRTILSGAELDRALERGHIKQVYRAACYEANTAFRGYALELWKMRLAARQSGRLQDELKWKVLAASFFGKWAQKGGFWENVSRTRELAIKHWLEYDYDTKVLLEFRQVGGVVQRRSQEPESGESSPAIAACCTAEARTLLYGLIGQAGRNETYYVDTDSLLVSPLGYRRLSDRLAPSELGGLKVSWHCESLQIYANKNYARDGRRVNAGIRPDAMYTDSGHIIQIERVGLQAQIHGTGGTGARSRTVTRRNGYHDH